LTEDEITGNAILFLLAGYDTTASTMTFMTYSLATNPKIQDRLIEEIDSILGKVRINITSFQEIFYSI
jgi:cytochrome P450